jgi:hypothetical protein
MEILKKKWYPVGQPWSDGSWAIAGHEDPHVGVFAFDCQCVGGFDQTEEPAKIVQYICELHNQSILSIRKEGD